MRGDEGKYQELEAMARRLREIADSEPEGGEGDELRRCADSLDMTQMRIVKRSYDTDEPA